MYVFVMCTHTHAYMIGWVAFTFSLHRPLCPSWPAYRCVPFCQGGVCLIEHAFFTGHTEWTKCAVAFQRWLSRAEQLCVKLCPVQSAEVNFTEINTIYNYIHRRRIWHRCRASLLHKWHRCQSALWTFGLWFHVKNGLNILKIYSEMLFGGLFCKDSMEITYTWSSLVSQWEFISWAGQ